ncbi:MAG: YggT family protein [bacterium]
MLPALAAIATFSAALRSILLAGGVAVGVVATADWAVRTRRISPFSGIARLVRSNVDPRLGGIERQVVRAGGHPSSTPWWALVAYVVVASLLLAGLDMAIGLIRDVLVASSGGGAGLVSLVIRWTFGFLRLALLVRVVASWFPRAAGSVWFRWSFGATEWMLRPLRRVIPSFGMMDITPIAAYFLLQFVEWLVVSALFPGL